ncbi:MAG: cbb3-type cytochrome c oxidase subunit 3 [Thalassobaculum sp.]
MSYHDVSVFAQSWGLVFLVTLFTAACAYALWPGNRARFEKAARLPLEED